MRRLLAPLMAAVLLTIVATPAVSGAGTSARWTAWLATNGTATLSVGTSGSGTLVLRLTGLTPRASYPVALERGTCAMPGTKRISLPAVKASSAGAVTRTFRLTAAQATSARASTKSGLLVRAGSLCGLFIVPLPQLALRPGDAYFSIGGRQQVVFARNLTSYWQTDFNTILGLTKAGGGRMVRVQLDSLGGGMTSAGVVDETWARKRITALLKGESDVTIAGECADGAEAVEKIKTLKPDLVFLDVQMPEMDGFDVIDAIGADRMPRTIFATAYEEYAIRAFDAQAMDYLLKPFDEERFRKSLDRARKDLQRGSDAKPDASIRALIESRPFLTRVPRACILSRP